MENGEYILKNYVSKFIDSKLKTGSRSTISVDRDTDRLFSEEGLFYACI
jgi:hypothetical protein